MGEEVQVQTSGVGVGQGRGNRVRVGPLVVCATGFTLVQQPVISQAALGPHVNHVHPALNPKP